jgi:hypothetical protein
MRISRLLCLFTLFVCLAFVAANIGWARDREDGDSKKKDALEDMGKTEKTEEGEKPEKAGKETPPRPENPKIVKMPGLEIDIENQGSSPPERSA